MRQVLSFCVFIAVLSNIVSPVLAISVRSTTDPVKKESVQIEYPAGEDFVRLKTLIDTNFSISNGKYRNNCIFNNKLCPNYKYTSVIEKAIKLIVIKTYTENVNFYTILFSDVNRRSQADINSFWSSSNSNDRGKERVISDILRIVPRGSTISDWKSLGFGNSIGGELLDASFGVDFTENANSSSMLGTIERKIIEMKRTNCQKSNQGNIANGVDCYSNVLPNKYLPTSEELSAESVYLNGGGVKIGNLKDDIEYTVTFMPQEEIKSSINTNINSSDSDSTVLGKYEGFMNDSLFIQTENISKREALENCIKNGSNNPDRSIRCLWNDTQIYPIVTESTAINPVSKPIPQSYTLDYKKEFYTLEEAKNELEPKNVINNNSEFITNSENQTGQLPCKNSIVYSVKIECTILISDLKEVHVALAGYNLDNSQYPDNIEALKLYLPKFPQTFTKNFSYKPTKNSRGQADYEIRYIGHIGEDNIESKEVQGKKDYKAMMSGATVPEIPLIFSHIPSDSMVLYIRNPANLIDILNQKSNTSQGLSGIDVSESIRGFIKTFFELEKFDQIEKNLKHEMAIVVNNLDATSPDIVIILSESDKEALSPTAKARVVGSKDGFIFIASSKESLEKVTNLAIDKSLKEAPDFHYVWWKKSDLVKDAMVFVGDAFFEKMLTLETYLTHYRKYRDYARLSSLQEMIWAYGDAFGKIPTGFSELSDLGFMTLTGGLLNEYSIVGGLVTHQNIGTLQSIKTIPEANYDFSKISRAEIEDYKYNVLKYRDIWRSSLDPMGIVINRYGDGMEIDFFMTPIPSLANGFLANSLNAYEKAMNDTDTKNQLSSILKDSLSFITNPKIRMGLFSFVIGYDSKKLQANIKNNKNIATYYQMFSREVLDGKDIFDYLGGEFAWSIGSIDPDILDGWNIEKVDVYGSVQVTSEEKGKELIDIIRTRILKEMGNSRGDEVEMIKGFLTKPLIEDYSGKKIYYVEGLPIPFIGKIGFAYTFVDDFFIIGLNRSTIKNIIDTAKTGDLEKKKIVNENSFEKGTFFATMVDGVNLSKQIGDLYEKNKSSIPRYMKYLDMEDIQSDPSIDSLIGVYYSQQDHNKRLGIPTKPFSYTLGILSITGDAEKLAVKIDPSGVKSLSGVTLQMWNNIESETSFPKEIMSEKGVPIAELLALSNFGDIISLSIISHLDSVLGGSDSLFRNVTFGMNMGDDEIGFRLRIFREVEGSKGSSSIGAPSDILVIGGMTMVLILLGGVIYYVIRRRKPEVIMSGVTPMSHIDQLVTVTPVSTVESVNQLDTTPINELSVATSYTVDLASQEMVTKPVLTTIPMSPPLTPQAPISTPVIVNEGIIESTTVTTPLNNPAIDPINTIVPAPVILPETK